jgi:hypothetical protein
MTPRQSKSFTATLPPHTPLSFPQTRSNDAALNGVIGLILFSAVVSVACRSPRVGSCFAALAVLVASVNVALIPPVPPIKWDAYNKSNHENMMSAEPSTSTTAADRPNVGSMSVDYAYGVADDAYARQGTAVDSRANVPGNAYVGQAIHMNYGVPARRPDSRDSRAHSLRPTANLRMGSEKSNARVAHSPQHNGGSVRCQHCGSGANACGCNQRPHHPRHPRNPRETNTVQQYYSCAACQSPAGRCACRQNHHNHENKNTVAEAAMRMPEYPVASNDRAASIAAVVPGLPQCCQGTPKDTIRNQGLYGIKGNLSCEILKRNAVQDARFVEPVGARNAWVAYNSYDQLHARDQYMIPSGQAPASHHRD